ncbi:kinase-like protein [Jackrogersella minutella]|nr:kinase-like protein [Jackrogersella minutella]
MTSLKKAEEDVRKMKEYFVGNPRFDFRGLVAQGNYGSASRVQYNDPDNKSLDSFLIKKAFATEHAEKTMRTERDYLLKLRGAMHIVQLIDIPNNPLSQQGTSKGLMGEWVILEWLEHGTIGDFITKTRNKGVDRLPNRLLWRLFLCLIRACIAMAWPPNRNDGAVSSEVVRHDISASNIMHNDLHTGNVLLGSPPTDAEHTIAPILKFIDFGLAGEWWWGENAPSGVESNIWDIGQLMIALITLERYVQIQRIERPGHKPAMFASAAGGPEIETDGNAILPLTGDESPFPQLDPLLRRLVCSCLATKPGDRPSLEDISYNVAQAVLDRDASFYPDHPEEQDDSISKLWLEITLYADTGPQNHSSIFISS